MRRAVTLACIAVALTHLLAADTVLDSSNTVVTAPMTLVDGTLHQVERTELAASGSAIVTIDVTRAGEYVLQALVEAPTSDADSFYVSFDQPPTDPTAIWDVVPKTEGFQWRTVTWRGNEARGPEGQAVHDKWAADNDALFATALKAAREHLGQPAGLAPLEWLVHANVSHYRAAGPEAAILLREHYATDPAIGRSIAYLAHEAYPRSTAAIDPEAFRLFEAVLRSNPDRATRGQAAFGIAMSAKADALLAPPTGEESEIARRKAVQLMESVRRDYGDVAYLKVDRPGETLGQLADRHLIELRALRLGAPAPEIVGRDLDGVPLKLSDYRGKVVMVVFWAAWCGPCIQAIPKEKKIVERFRGRPFVLVGVNGDGSLAAANKAVKQHEVPWRSFWDREDSYISNAWNIAGWPTVYVIDHEGIIQQRLFLNEEGLEPLVAAAEKK